MTAGPFGEAGSYPFLHTQMIARKLTTKSLRTPSEAFSRKSIKGLPVFTSKKKDQRSFEEIDQTEQRAALGVAQRAAGTGSLLCRQLEKIFSIFSCIDTLRKSFEEHSTIQEMMEMQHASR